MMKNQIKILLVEDEAITAMMLKQEFQELGYQVCKSNGRAEDAIKKANNETPDIILMDIHLIGDMDGIDTAENILKNRSTPIIFMTGYEDDNCKNRTLKLKPVAYLIKPVDASEIDAVIKKHLKLNHPDIT